MGSWWVSPTETNPGIVQMLSTDFRRRCAKKLEKLGDRAMDSQKHDEAVKHYSDILALEPPNLSDILYKRSKARVFRRSWKVALIDADKVRVHVVMSLKQT